MTAEAPAPDARPPDPRPAALNHPRPGSVEHLVELMRVLRSAWGCPWDREQSLQTLKQHLVEECYEVIDAIDSGDRDALREELGDLLLQVLFQAQLCDEEGAFSFHDVARALGEKLIRRHRHVFGDVRAASAAEALQSWDSVKHQEKAAAESVIQGIPRHLPALQRAQKVQKKVARVGFDWSDVHDVLAKIEEELRETRQAIADRQDARVREEIGDLLFAVVNLSRFLGHNAEDALDETIGKFTRRFRAIEARLHGAGRNVTDCDLAELDRLWNEVKAEEDGSR
jgi:tetrapyrrole methylase family protein/MazG family protein